MKESVLYEIFEICRDYHNAKMTTKDSSIFTDEYRDKILGKILGKICDLYGLDLGEIESICKNIDGCCFEIQQGDAPDIMGEVSDIDHYSSQIQDIVYEIGKLLGNY